MTDLGTFTCDLCGLEFQKLWTDEVAEKEYVRKFSEEEREDERCTVCDKCYELIMMQREERYGYREN